MTKRIFAGLVLGAQELAPQMKDRETGRDVGHTLTLQTACAARCDIHGCGEIWAYGCHRKIGTNWSGCPSGQALRSGSSMRARILLKTDRAGWTASQVAAVWNVAATVFRAKRRYAEEGLDGVLHDHPQANRYRKLDAIGAEAHLIALACSDAPEGHEHWTLHFVGRQGGGIGLGAASLSYWRR